MSELPIQQGGLRVLSGIVPASSASTYGTHYSYLGVGGYVEVPNIDYRNSIPPDSNMNDEGYSTGRRRYGMMVYVIDEDKLYRLFPFSGGSVVSMETFTGTSELNQVTMLSNNNGWIEVPDLSVLITGGTYFSGNSSIVLYDSTGGTVSITGITTTDIINPGDGRVLVSTGNSENIFVAQSNMVFNGTNLNITGGTFITDSGGSLHSSAIIQFKSTTKGVLLPGMTTSQKNAIVNPTTGLTVYDSTIEDISVYTSSGWTGVIAERDNLQKVTERGNSTNSGLIISGTTYLVGSGSTTGNTFVTSNSANTQTFTIKDNGNILIGTTTDSGNKLDVNGNVRIQAGLTISNVGTYALSVSNGTTSGIGSQYFNAGGILYWGVNNVSGDFLVSTNGISYASFFTTSTRALQFGTNQTARMTIFPTTGNIGINTITDAGYKLDVNGSTRIVGSGSTTGNTFVTSNSANTQTFTIKDNGNVLIGTTTDGGEKLYVNGNTSVNGNLQILNNGGLTFYNGASIFSSHYITTSNELLTANSNNTHGAWKFNNYYVSIAKNLAVGTTLTDFVAPSQTFLVLGSSVFSGSVISSGVTRLSGQTSIIGSGTTSGSTAFSVQNSTGGTLLNLFSNGNLNVDNGVLYVDGDNGRVGIGITSPTYKLQVGDFAINSSNKIVIATANSGVNGFYVYAGASNYVRTAIEHDYGTSLTRFMGSYNTGTNIIGQDANNGHTILYSGPSSSERVRVVGSNGNVLIGTTTDAGYKLDVNGTGRFSSTLTVATTASGGFPSNSILISTSESGNGGRISWGDSNTSILRLSNSLYFREYTGNFVFESTGSSTILFAVRPDGTTVSVGNFVTTGSITAASALARGVYMNNTLVAAANNDVLVGLDINPTFTNGAFTGVTNLAARIQGNTEISRSGADTQLTVARGSGASFIIQAKANSTSNSEGVNLYWTNNTWLKFVLGSSVVANFSNVGNLLVGTSTDSGYKLDVVGADSRFNGVRVGLGAGGVSTNTVVGSGALNANTTGSQQTAVGYQAGYSNTSGTLNTALGSSALYANTTGNNNTAVGRAALFANITGIDNVAVGLNSLVTITGGSQNVAIGRDSLYFNTASSNTAVGYQAGYSNTTAAGITAIGYQAGYSNTTALITAIGYFALKNNVDGSPNTAVGYGALASNVSNIANTAVGHNALGSNTAGSNTAVGHQSSTTNTTGSNNSSFGTNSLRFNTTGIQNTAIGSSALSNTTSSFNVGLGYIAGAANTTGDNNIFIGYQSTGVSATESDRTWIGNSSTTSTWLAGNVLIGTTTNAGYKLDVSGTTRVVSTGSTSGSTTLTLQNSTGRTTTEFRSDGVIGISSASTFTTQVTSVISASTTNSGIAIVPNGTGAFTLSIPDGTDTGGGNARGQYAVDLKLGGRTAATQVASGNYSAVIGGDVSTASGVKSLAGGSAFATGTNSVALGGSSTASGSGSVAIGGEQGGGLGATASGRAAIAFGLANTATADFSNSLGGLSNSASGSYSSVVGGQSNTSSTSNSSILGGWLNINSGGSYGSIAGGRSNVLSTGSWYTFIGGGWNNGIINGDYSVIVGGFSNSATTQYAAVIGGSTNRSTGLYSLTHGLGNIASSTGSTSIGFYNTASGGYSIAMGSGSTASGLHSTVSGGYNNRATGVGVFIGGGSGNAAGGLDNYQTIVGGNSNTITAAGGSFIGGGQSNTISNGSGSGYCVIVGGLGNLSNGGIYNTIGGGQSNTASASYATVVGGLSNTASGAYSIAGGHTSIASGDWSTAFGDSNATGTGSFAAGTSATASGNRSISIGQSTTASGSNSIALGLYAAAASTGSFSVGEETYSESVYGIAFGYQSHTRLRAQQALSSGNFGSEGSAQQSLLTSRAVSATTSGSTITLSLDGTGVTNLITPYGNNRAWNVVVNTITVCTVVSGGTLTVGDAHAGEYKFLFKRVGGTSTISPITTSSEVADTSMATASFSFSAGTSQQMAITFNAPNTANNSTFRAVAKVALTEVAW